MTTIAWVPNLPAAACPPATFRLYASRVVAAPAADGAGAADWRREVAVDFWKPQRMEWGVNGKPTTLRLRRALGAGPGRPVRARAEDATFGPGDRIRLVEPQDGGPRGTIEREWFRGYVAQERMLIQPGAGGEVCEVVAYGPEILLRGKAVSGQWHADPGTDEAVIGGTVSSGGLVRSNTFRSHLPVIFNADGEPNASPDTIGASDASWHLDSDAEADTARGRTFDGPGRRIGADESAYQAAHWRAASAIQSLIEIVDDYEVISPESMSLLPQALAETAIGEVAVEGMDLLAALRALLVPIGYGFAIQPWADRDGRHVLSVFPLHGATNSSRVRKPYMAPICGPAVRITDPEGQRAEVQRIDFLRDNHNVANDVTVLGDQKRRQVALVFSSTGSQLRPAWDMDTHDLSELAVDDVVDPMQWPIAGQSGQTVTSFDKQFTYGAKGNSACRHAFRSFTWNEDGAFNSVTDGMGDLAGFGAGPEGSAVRRPRPIARSFLRDDADTEARDLPALVQLGIEGDDEAWIQVPAVIWADRAGFTIPVNPLWGWHPYAGDYARHATSSGETLFEKYGRYSYLTLLHNALRGSGDRLTLRLVGSAESDSAVMGRAPRRIGSSWPFRAEKIVRAPNRYRFRDVPDGSDPFGFGSSRHDTRDDSDDAADYAARVRDVLEDEVGHGSILLRHLTRAYCPGDVIPETQGRVIDLTVRSSAGSRAPVVSGVIWDFHEGANKTELTLDTSLLRTAR